MFFGKDTSWLPVTASTRLVLGVTLALLCAPVLIDLAVSGPAGPFTEVAPDTFYCLTVARKIVSLDKFEQARVFGHRLEG